VFVGVCRCLSTYIFQYYPIKAELGAGINPGMDFTPFSSSILDEMRFKPTTFKSRVKFANHLTALIDSQMVNDLTYKQKIFGLSLKVMQTIKNR
jgi:hypothetical protein